LAKEAILTQISNLFNREPHIAPYVNRIRIKQREKDNETAYDLTGRPIPPRLEVQGVMDAEMLDCVKHLITIAPVEPKVFLPLPKLEKIKQWVGVTFVFELSNETDAEDPAPEAPASEEESSHDSVQADVNDSAV